MKSIKLGFISVALVSLGLGACANGTPSSQANAHGKVASGAAIHQHGAAHKQSVSFSQLQRMAQSGDADAQYALGYRYYYGIGVSQNTNTSLTWMSQAASQGQKQALQAIKLIKQAHAANQANTPSAAASSSQAQLEQHQSLSHAQTAAASSTQARASQSQIPGFTLQLMGTHDKQSLIDFIMSNNLQDKATYYRRSYDGQDWYVLVSGRYSSQKEALDAIDRLPENLKSMNPWVKPLGLVKQEMQS